MKVSEILKDVETELAEETIEDVKAVVKDSLKRINSAKKTLRKLEKEHEKLLGLEVDDLELDGFEY